MKFWFSFLNFLEFGSLNYFLSDFESGVCFKIAIIHIIQCIECNESDIRFNFLWFVSILVFCDNTSDDTDDCAFAIHLISDIVIPCHSGSGLGFEDDFVSDPLFAINLNSFLIYICVWSVSHREITRINLSYKQ